MPTPAKTADEPFEGATGFRETVRKMETSIDLFYSVYDDEDDKESYVGPKPDHMDHLASWLIGEGWTKKS
jgi:hypothetical protein